MITTPHTFKPDERPWFRVEIGCMADDQQQVEDWLGKALELLPFPGDFVANVAHSPSLSRGEGMDLVRAALAVDASEDDDEAPPA